MLVPTRGKMPAIPGVVVESTEPDTSVKPYDWQAQIALQQERFREARERALGTSSTTIEIPQLLKLVAPSETPKGFVLLHHHIRKARLGVFAQAKANGISPGSKVTMVSFEKDPTKRISDHDLGIVSWNLTGVDSHGEWRPIKVTWHTGGYSFCFLKELRLIEPDEVKKSA